MLKKNPAASTAKIGNDLHNKRFLSKTSPRGKPLIQNFLIISQQFQFDHLLKDLKPMRWLFEKNPDLFYFERVSETVWVEKRNGEEVDQYTQFSAETDENGRDVIVLNRDDGLFIKLAHGKAWWSWIEDKITLMLANGYWQESIRK